MPLLTRQLGAEHEHSVREIWSAATTARRQAQGKDATLTSSERRGSRILARGEGFGVGVFDGDRLLGFALGMPALADDARSTRRVPGLAHISHVGTRPEAWGRGIGTISVRAVQMQAVRRGYARAQLWTQTTNQTAQRLYEREGFQRSGRTGTSADGEPTLHYIKELTPPTVTLRAAARLVVLDPDDRVLLMHWRDPVDGFCLWEPPGGGVEPGESALDAVVREWREETELPLPELPSGVRLSPET